MMWHRLLAAAVVTILVAASCSDSASTTTTTSTTLGPCPPSAQPPLIPDQLDDVGDHISNTLMPDWQAARHDAGYQANRCHHDWTTDDCSAPGVGSTGVSFDFTHPCHRHDFGYRNYKRIEGASGTDTWNEVSKRTVDDQFLADTRDHCSGRSWHLKNQCYAWSQVFYLAVRAFG